jgi:hypothetical protein
VETAQNIIQAIKSDRAHNIKFRYEPPAALKDTSVLSHAADTVRTVHWGLGRAEQEKLFIILFSFVNRRLCFQLSDEIVRLLLPPQFKGQSIVSRGCGNRVTTHISRSAMCIRLLC